MNENKWNISEDAIAAALNDGTSPDELAKVFTEKLNAAMNRQKKITQKHKDAEMVVKFLVDYYPIIFDGLTVEILLKALEDLQDVLGPVTAVIEKANQSAEKMLNNKENTKKPTTAVGNTLEDLLNIFGK